MAFSRSPEQNREIYEGLRLRALSVSAKDIGIQSNGKLPESFGVSMEWSQRQTLVTLVTFVSGDASLYFSSGGGILGGIQYDSVRSAAIGLVSFSNGFLPHFVQTETFPLPSDDTFRFYILTTMGVFTAEAPAASVTSGHNALSPLFGKANAVITAVREADEKSRS